MPTHSSPDSSQPERLAQRYQSVRAATMARAAPLSAEDQCIQSMAQASPTK